MAKKYQIIGLILLVLVIVLSWVPIIKCSKKPAGVARKEDIRFIKCQVCEILARQLYHQVQDKQAKISPKKISKYDIIEITENVCNLKKREADWILKIDIVEQGDRLKFVGQNYEGQCDSECKTIVRACQEVMGYSDTDVAEYLYKKKPQIYLLVNFLCNDLTESCRKKPPHVPKNRIPGEPFIAKSQKEAEMEKMLKSMEIPLLVAGQITGHTLTLQWPTTLCHLNMLYCDYSKNPRRKSFTIHGLWPYDTNGVSVTKGIRAGLVFDPNAVNQVHDIKNAWPSFLTTNKDVKFWEHEWDKHGQFQNTIQNGMIGYFEATVKLWQAHNVYDYLVSRGIFFGMKHEKDDVVKAISDGVGHRVVIVCKCRPNKAPLVLTEVKICVDDTATKFIDCPQTIQNSCRINSTSTETDVFLLNKI